MHMTSHFFCNISLETESWASGKNIPLGRHTFGRSKIESYIRNPITYIHKEHKTHLDNFSAKMRRQVLSAFEFITRNFKPILSLSYHQCANRILKMKGIVYLSVLLSWSYWICNILYGYTIHNKKWTYSIAKEITSFEF